MAEFLNQVVPVRQTVEGSGDGFDAMGKPIPLYRRTAGLEHCRVMGLVDPERAWACVGGVSEQLERDQPYKAMEVGMQYLDLIGVYRLFAVLLTARNPAETTPCPATDDSSVAKRYGSASRKLRRSKRKLNPGSSPAGSRSRSGFRAGSSSRG